MSDALEQDSWHERVLAAIAHVHGYWGGNEFGILHCPGGTMCHLTAAVAALFDPDLVFWYDKRPTKGYAKDLRFDVWSPFHSHWVVESVAESIQDLQITREFDSDFVVASGEFAQTPGWEYWSVPPGDPFRRKVPKVDALEDTRRWTVFDSGERYRGRLVRVKPRAEIGYCLTFPWCEKDSRRTLRLASNFGLPPDEQGWVRHSVDGEEFDLPPGFQTPAHVASEGILVRSYGMKGRAVVVCGKLASDYCAYYTLDKCLSRVAWVNDSTEVDRLLKECDGLQDVTSVHLVGTAAQECLRVARQGDYRCKILFANGAEAVEGLRRHDSFVSGSRALHLVAFSEGVSEAAAQPIVPPVFGLDGLANEGGIWISASDVEGYSPPSTREMAEATWFRLWRSKFGKSLDEWCGLRFARGHQRAIVQSAPHDPSVPVGWVVLSDVEVIGTRIYPKYRLAAPASGAGATMDRAVRVAGDIRSLARIFADKVECSFVNEILRCGSGGAGKGADKLGWRSASRKQHVLSLRDLQRVAEREGAPPKYGMDAILRLVDLGILERGFCLQCLSCGAGDWYHESAVLRSFSCYSCGAEQRLGPASFCIPPERSPEPVFMYALAEPIRRIRVDNGYVTALALAKVMGADLNDSGSRFVVAERAVFQGERQLMEVDFIALMDDRLILGECKTCESGKRQPDVEKKQLERYAKLAGDTGAAEVVFATDSVDGWSDGVKDRCKRVLGGEASGVQCIFWGLKELHSFGSVFGR